ncbi:pentatricopeptide repeat-containing protein At1g80270, mitochondrial-like [Tasmannia lanceolata]|uniref:pentatricopeptide repeat-containing protein At1g80270, mitochondrial-like n=1 Tax=Tasmannia lanceolata TaxID=3420 RepID=UPI004063203E
MLALRRAANPIRIHCHHLGASRACCAKPEVPSDNSELGVGFHKHEQFLSCKFLSPKMFYPNRSAPGKFFMGSRSLSSQAGAKSSDDEEDNLEDGFSELEMAPETDSLGEKNPVDESAEELISETELSDDDNDDDDVDLSEATNNKLNLSDTETGPSGDKESRKKILSSPLFKVVMESPYHSIKDAISKWVEEGNSLGRTEISLAMLNLRKRKMFGRALQLLECLKENNQLEFAERDYASYLDLIAKVYGLAKAEKYIVKIPESFRSEVIYRTLLANCTGAVNVKKAEQVFNKMRDLGFPLSAFSCNQLLLLYKRSDRRKIADVLLMMEKENVKPTRFTYSLLVDTKGRSNDITGMELVVETMKAEGVEPDFLTLAMMARYYISAGLKEKADAILEEMEGSGLKENHDSCKALLPLYAALGKADDVERVWKVFEVRPRLDEGLAAIEAWGKLGSVEKAEEVFEKMFKLWNKLSVKCYNALLVVYANHKMLSKGKDLAKRMSDNGVMIGPFTWDALVKLYVGAGEVEKADSILQKATQQSPQQPLYNSYLAILDKYAKRGDIHNAEKVFHRLRQCGYVGRSQPYYMLLQAYVAAKTPAYGFRERMKADNIFPSKSLAGQLARIDSFKKTQLSELLD